MRDRDRDGAEAQREGQIPEKKVQRPAERDWGWGDGDTVGGEETEP